MNRATRVLLMSGVAVAAGMAFSAPAMAATSTPAPAGASAQATPRHSWTEGRYRSFRSCSSEGRRGVWRGDWDHYRCVPIGHGWFALVVSEDWNHGGGNGWGNGGNNWHPGNHKPGWKPGNHKPDWKPGDKPGNKPDWKPGDKPGNKPDWKPGDMPAQQNPM